MRRLARAAEAWIWSEILIRVIGIVALGLVVALAWAMLKWTARIMGL